MTPASAKAPSSLALRELTAGEFVGRYGCDRFTASVLASRYRYIIEHMCSQLVVRAFSPVLREHTDLSAALSGPPDLGYPMPAVAQTLPLFFGSIPEAVRISLEEHGVDDLRGGDVLLVNDPYRVGTHVNDICLIRPVFHEAELVGALTIRAHMLDWGGKTKGGFGIDKASLYEDGLVFAPTLVHRDGAAVPAVLRFIRDNTRFPRTVLPDIETIVSCLDVGHRLLAESIDRYGIEAYRGSIRYACDASAEAMTEAVRALPDGTYVGQEQLDSNGLGREDTECRVVVTITKAGSEIEIDLSGSATANASSLNCTWPDAKTAIVIALKWLLDPATPYTSAACRHVDVVVPPDSIVNPSPPLCSNLYWVPLHAVVHAIMRALNPVLGERAIAFDAGDFPNHVVGGVDATTGEPWFASGGTVMHTLPWGASAAGDADSSQVNPFVNFTWGGDEPVEAANPFVILRRDHLADTGGAGRHRGGSSSAVDSLWLSAGEHRAWQFMARRPSPTGVAGGGSGQRSGGWLWDPERSERVPKAGFLPLDPPDDVVAEALPLFGMVDPTTNRHDPDGTYTLQLSPVPASAGSLVRFVCNGGGGWGDPFDRPAEQVLTDVRDEYVSIEGAARDYGVVVIGDPQRDPEGLMIDDDATAALRGSR